MLLKKIIETSPKSFLFEEYRASYLSGMEYLPSENTGRVIPFPSRSIITAERHEQEIFHGSKTIPDKYIDSKDQLAFLTEVVRINISQLADLFKVERPSIYSWLDGSQIPRRTRIKRIEDIYSVFYDWNHGIKLKLGDYLYKSIIDNKSLYDLLIIDDINVKKAKEFVEKINKILLDTSNRTAQRKKGLEDSGFSPVSDEQKRRVLNNLIRKA